MEGNEEREKRKIFFVKLALERGSEMDGHKFCKRKGRRVEK